MKGLGKYRSKTATSSATASAKSTVRAAAETVTNTAKETVEKVASRLQLGPQLPRRWPQVRCIEVARENDRLDEGRYQSSS